MLGVLAGLVAAGAVGYVAFALVRSVPVRTVLAPWRSALFPGRLRLAWPSQGEAAVAVQGVGLIGARSSAVPTPIASVAKVMTAYVVLRDHPLTGGASGPQITVTPADAAVYRADEASGQSVVLVQAGERLTERQALQAMLLPSGNNIATLLARWDAGSEPAFLRKMNAFARTLGLSHTRYTSASGVQPSTVSTASDQVRLAMRALQVPALAQTVAMRQATLAVAGRQYNGDTLLGKDGIVGVKPGTTAKAGGCFVFAAHQQLGGRSVLVVGAVLHQAAGRPPSDMAASAFNATTTLLVSMRRLLLERRVLKRGATLAWVTAPWADPVALRAARPVSLLGWPGVRVRATVQVDNIHAPLHRGQPVGIAVISAGDQRQMATLVPSRTLPDPSLAWRLTNP
jgi:serine-type D-Ala-D-Ala carboxypeptidase (penicillin-binding protein 5/6)